MKKLLTVLMLAVFVLAFVGAVLATKAEAKKPICPKDPPCRVQVFADGSKYICCSTYVVKKKECVLIDLPCYWEYPNP